MTVEDSPEAVERRQALNGEICGAIEVWWLAWIRQRLTDPSLPSPRLSLRTSTVESLVFAVAAPFLRVGRLGLMHGGSEPSWTPPASVMRNMSGCLYERGTSVR